MLHITRPRVYQEPLPQRGGSSATLRKFAFDSVQKSPRAHTQKRQESKRERAKKVSRAVARRMITEALELSFPCQRQRYSAAQEKVHVKACGEKEMEKVSRPTGGRGGGPSN